MPSSRRILREYVAVHNCLWPLVVAVVAVRQIFRSQVGNSAWQQVRWPDIEQWMAQLLDRYGSAYASIQFRALRQFFEWLAAATFAACGPRRLRQLPGYRCKEGSA